MSFALKDLLIAGGLFLSIAASYGVTYKIGYNGGVAHEENKLLKSENENLVESIKSIEGVLGSFGGLVEKVRLTPAGSDGPAAVVLKSTYDSLPESYRKRAENGRAVRPSAKRPGN